MNVTLSAESANWVLPSERRPSSSKLSNYEEFLPTGVNKANVTNYLRNRGTLNIGQWAIEGKRMSTLEDSTVGEPTALVRPPPNVKGEDAIRNYTRDRITRPNLICGNLDPPNPHHSLRVKKEGIDNYEKNRNSQMKSLLYNYGKSPLPSQPLPHTQGETATNLFYSHTEGRISALLHNYGHDGPSPRPAPHVKGTAAEANLKKSYGSSQILQHAADYRPSSAEPHVKGTQAQLNYDMGQGHSVYQLFHEYGKLPRSVRAPPKVQFGGVENMLKGQGDAMRKTLSQCPPSHRYLERPQSVQL